MNTVHMNMVKRESLYSIAPVKWFEEVTCTVDTCSPSLQQFTSAVAAEMPGIEFRYQKGQDRAIAYYPRDKFILGSVSVSAATYRVTSRKIVNHKFGGGISHKTVQSGSLSTAVGNAKKYLLRVSGTEALDYASSLAREVYKNHIRGLSSRVSASASELLGFRVSNTNNNINRAVVEHCTTIEDPQVRGTAEACLSAIDDLQAAMAYEDKLVVGIEMGGNVFLSPEWAVNNDTVQERMAVLRMVKCEEGGPPSDIIPGVGFVIDARGIRGYGMFL